MDKRLTMFKHTIWGIPTASAIRRMTGNGCDVLFAATGQLIGEGFSQRIQR